MTGLHSQERRKDLSAVGLGDGDWHDGGGGTKIPRM